MICDYGIELDALVEKAKGSTKDGKVAQYIPALAKANRDTLAISIFDGRDTCFSAGHSEERFTIQSISKVLTLALALVDHELEFVFFEGWDGANGRPVQFDCQARIA